MDNLTTKSNFCIFELSGVAQYNELLIQFQWLREIIITDDADEINGFNNRARVALNQEKEKV